MPIDVTEFGAFPSATSSGLQIRFGLYLPDIRAADGFDVVVRVIKREDRFDPAIQPQDFHLTWNPSQRSVDAVLSQPWG